MEHEELLEKLADIDRQISDKESEQSEMMKLTTEALEILNGILEPYHGDD